MSDGDHIQDHWVLICTSARSHAARMAASCRRKASTMILREADSFCDRDPPQTDSELSRRQKQSMHLISRIGSISHADLMGRSHPSVSDQILEETKAFLERVDLDESPYEESLVLTSKISALCNADRMQHL